MTRTTQPNLIRGDDYAPARAFLASPLAALRPDFAGRALARIEAQHDELGESYLYGSLAALVRELAEEAEDLGAWAALLADRVERDDRPDADRARALLAGIAQRAGEADALIGELRRMLAWPAS
ncbi:MAG: hypothetical protein ACR2LK_12700 [Solirubrobacteraceae bacterium]